MGGPRPHPAAGEAHSGGRCLGQLRAAEARGPRRFPPPPRPKPGQVRALLRPLPGGWGLHAGRGREPAYWVAVGRLALEGQGVRLGEGGRLPGPDLAMGLVAPLALETESFLWKATWGATYQGSSKPLTRVPCLPAASLRFPQASGLMSPQDPVLIGRSVEHGAVLEDESELEEPRLQGEADTS